MEKIIKSLVSCPLFTGFSNNEIQDLLHNTPYSILTFKKNQMISIEGETCSNIGIIIEGSVDIKKFFASGKSMTIVTMNNGDIFGEVLVFAYSNKYPSTIVASKDTKILFISRDSALKLSYNNLSFLNNIMSMLANKVLMLNDKIKYLSIQTIRQKISTLLLDYYKKQNNLSLILPFNRKEMSEILGIPRPSLSREMINMRDEGLINFNKNNINILHLNALEEILLN